MTAAAPLSVAFVAAVRRAGRRIPRAVLKVEALAEMAGWLLVVEVGLRALPVVRLARLLGVELRTTPSGLQPAPVAGVLILGDGEFRRLVALDALIRHLRFASGPCLRRALVGGRVLRRLRPELVLGVASRPEGLAAHAWVEASGASFGRSDAFVPLVEQPPMGS